MAVFEVGKPCPVPVGAMGDGATALELWEDGLYFFMQLPNVSREELEIYRDLRSYAYYESDTTVPIAVWVFEFAQSSYVDANFDARAARPEAVEKFLRNDWNALQAVILDGETVRSIRMIGLDWEAIRLFKQTIRKQLAVQYTQQEYDRALSRVYTLPSERLYALGRKFQHRPAPSKQQPTAKSKKQKYQSLADRLRGHIKSFEGRYPKIWREIDRLRSERGTSLPGWPEWCFVPLAVSMELVHRRFPQQPTPQTLMDASLLSALSAWRVTQGIYDFHPELFDRLVETPLDGELPVALFDHMPEWCCYLSFAGQEWDAPMPQGAQGAFAFMEHDMNTGRRELRFLIDADDEDGTPRFLPVVLHLGGERTTIEDAIRSFAENVRQQLEQGGPPDLPPPDDVEESAEAMGLVARPLVSLLLYLCSANAEIEHNKNPARKLGERPEGKRVKGGIRFFPPPEASHWKVGYRIGAAIGRAREEARKEAGSRTTGVERRSPVPHIRRAHWHTFWKGPRSDPERRFPVVKWLPPIFVKGEARDDEIVPVIKPVR